jgi:hypothetical protein
MALDCRQTSVREDKGENYEKCQKTYKEKKVSARFYSIC